MTVMTKRGREDNVLTYEHICDSFSDLQTIPNEYINLGSTAIVLQGTAGVEIYMATSMKQWIKIN